MSDKQKEIINLLKALFGGFFMAVAIKIFVKQADIVPAGFSGIAVLIQKIALKFFNKELPFGLLNLLLNIPPAILSLKMIGKKYTIMSFLSVIEVSLLADLIPSVVLSEDILILSVFGAIINAFGISLVLLSGTSTGGTDFISMSISNKYHISTLKYVMVFNIALIIIQGFLFGFSKSFYSIIYQYVGTQVLSMRYKHYEKRTLFIISENTDDIVNAILAQSPHSLTKIVGEGCYTHKQKNILYTITTVPELRKTIDIIKNVDKNAFINVIDSKEVEGKFNYLPVDIAENNIVADKVENKNE